MSAAVGYCVCVVLAYDLYCDLRRRRRRRPTIMLCCAPKLRRANRVRLRSASFIKCNKSDAMRESRAAAVQKKLNAIRDFLVQRSTVSVCESELWLRDVD